MIERGRAGRSESQVTRTKVFCRSAPGSRSPSLVREKARGRRRKAGVDEHHRVPSLARTQTEDDEWNGGKGRPSTANDVKNRYLSGIDADPMPSTSSEDEPEEDEQEHELDLARMLLHPKRQHSIRSLRRHLESGGGASRYNRPPPSPLCDGGGYPYQQEQWGGGWARRGVGVGDDEDDEAEAYARFVGAHDSRRSASSNHTRGPMPVWGEAS